MAEKDNFEFDTGLANMTNNVMYGLKKAGFLSKNICASIPNGIVRVIDGPGNIWRITITKECSYGD